MESMKRADRQIENFDEIIKVLDKCGIVFVSFSQNNKPYITPMNFGYEVENGALFIYLHGAKEGKKHNIAAQNPNVSFSGVSFYETAKVNEYRWTCYYKSVFGEGIISEVKEEDIKIKGLDLLMKHYNAGKIVWPQQVLERVKVMKIEVQYITGKQNVKQ